MNTFEDRLQVALRDLSDDVGYGPPLRWAPPGPPDRRRARSLLAVAAVVVVAIATSVVVLRHDEPSIVEPVRQPPRVVGLSGQETSTPGRSVLAFTLADPSRPNNRKPYVLAVGAQKAVGLPLDEVLPSFNYARPQLSAGGGDYLVQDERRSSYYHSGDFPSIVVVDLDTGRRNPLGGVLGFCPELSPDSRWVAYLSDTGVRRVEVRTGRQLPVQRDETRPDVQGGCAGGSAGPPTARCSRSDSPGRSSRRSPTPPRCSISTDVLSSSSRAISSTGRWPGRRTAGACCCTPRRPAAMRSAASTRRILWPSLHPRTPCPQSAGPGHGSSGWSVAPETSGS